MDNWTTRPLGEFLERITYGFTNPMPTTDKGPLMVTAKDINYGRVLHEQARYTSWDAFNQLLTDKSRPEVGDVLVTKDGTLGRIAVVERSGICINQSVALLRPSEIIRSRFLKYLLEEPLNFARMLGDADGSTIKHIYITRLAKMEVSVPDVNTQDRILAVLRPLDDKIELSRQMNETLEEMAQALFRDWFVDFGPVRRKRAGATDPVSIMGGLTRDPTGAAQIAAMFPDAFDDTDIPVGWSEAPIGELVKIQGGSTPSTADESLWSPGVHHWATPKDLSNMDNLALFGTSRQISDAGLAKITSGLLPVGTVLLSSRAPIGYLAIAQVPVAINQGFIGLLPTAEIGSAYLYFWCKANMDKITANANGSTFQEISKRNFRPITSAVPDNRNIVAKFGEIATPLIDRIVAAAKETQILAETRDYLLPRLMSGEVRAAPLEEERA